jgi:hypothetical protein
LYNNGPLQSRCGNPPQHCHNCFKKVGEVKLIEFYRLNNPSINLEKQLAGEVIKQSFLPSLYSILLQVAKEFY